MKRINNIYDRMTDINNIINVYDYEIRKNTKNKKKLEEFDNFYSQNIKEIKEELISGNYIPGEYNIFFVREPKLRTIMSQSIKDKIINHLVARYFLINVFEDVLIEENIATRKNRGTHYGLKLFKKYLNSMNKKYDNFYILKFDISKYFYNIDHNIVKKIINRKIKDKKAINIIEKIIDSTNMDYINNKIEILKNRELSKRRSFYEIQEINNIPYYQKDKGCSIGNMTSQIIGILYLNELDHYIKNQLKVKYYIRYMDDGILVHEDKEYLKYCLTEIDRIVKKYKLELNNKTKIYKSNEGVEFLGFNFIITNNKVVMKIKNSTKKRFKKNINKEKCVIDSYIGHLKHGNCGKLIYNMLKKNKTCRQTKKSLL